MNKTVRNPSIEIVRAIATILVACYHCRALTGVSPITISFFDQFLYMGGEIGVTLFFILSGYGIFYSLEKKDENDVRFVPFIRRRFFRIAPHYYFNIFVCLLCTSAAATISKDGISNILGHLIFIQNLVPAWHGGINGVLWTMGVTVQFYLIAIPLFNCVKKHPYISVSLSIVVTVICKMCIFIYMSRHGIKPGVIYFIYGRQLLTSLDNFVLGMFLSKVRKKKIFERHLWINRLFFIGGIALLDKICFYGLKFGIHTNNFSGYIWHSEVAIVLAAMIFLFTKINIEPVIYFFKPLLWISKNEYPIYLWHLLVIRTLLDNSAFVQSLLSREMYWTTYFVLLIGSFSVGVVMNKAFKNNNK